MNWYFFCQRVLDHATRYMAHEQREFLLTFPVFLQRFRPGNYQPYGETYYDDWKGSNFLSHYMYPMKRGVYLYTGNFQDGSWQEYAGVLLHEFGHVLLGKDCTRTHGGHGDAWRTACNRLGIDPPMQGGIEVVYNGRYWCPGMYAAVEKIAKELGA